MEKPGIEIDLDKLERVREIGTETFRETVDSAFAEVIRVAAVQGLVRSAEDGAFAALLEPRAEERMWR